ncbi:MAG TPA: hypothetical protein VKX28_29325 [Xanthobacteraceae bacterium]|nr:hypothetical protein [Xanthobacteraceae bacterium]
MATAVHKLGARARTGQSASRVLFVLVFFAALLGSAALVGYKLITPEKPIPRDQYRGVVQLAPDERGQCQRFEFDNQTGKMRRQGAGWCSDESLVSPSPNGSFGPLSGVRDYFRSR